MKLDLSPPDYLKDFIADSREKVTREFEKNERLIWLLGAGISIIYISFVFYLASESESAENRYISTQTRLAQLQNQIGDEGWSTKAADAITFNKTLKDRFWPGDTPGLAEAGFERWIRQTMAEHGIAVRQVQLTRAPVVEDQIEFGNSTLSSVERIRAKVIGSLNEAAVIRFLNDAAFHDSWVIVEQLVARGGRSDRFEMDITTFYITGQRGQ